MSLTIAYITCREDCRIQWALSSIVHQMQHLRELEFIIVDFFADEEGRKEWFQHIALKDGLLGAKIQHVAPKPNVWNGPHRLTKQDWFAAASQRNTALCLCETSHIAFVDDLSVLMPGWLDATREAVAGDYVGLGAYKKVQNLVVENGIAVSFNETPAGTDNRLSIVSKNVSECNGEWLYGCSLVAPLEHFMRVDGWPESLCGGLGFEDCLMGIVMGNAGSHFKYDRRMLTLESDELHAVEPAFRREDYGVSPDDKSNRALRIAKASKTFDNGFGPGGIRELRANVLAGASFPIPKHPEHEWYTGKLLSEL